jgi:hypothetical protein
MHRSSDMARAERYTSFTSLLEAINAFDAGGFREIFRADHEGLRASHDDRVFTPASLQVMARARIEGDSNPDEETLVFALRDPDTDLKGTFTIVFGPNIDPLDEEVVQSLECNRLPDGSP